MKKIDKIKKISRKIRASCERYTYEDGFRDFDGTLHANVSFQTMGWSQKKGSRANFGWENMG